MKESKQRKETTFKITFERKEMVDFYSLFYEKQPGR